MQKHTLHFLGKILHSEGFKFFIVINSIIALFLLLYSIEPKLNYDSYYGYLLH